MPHPLLGGNAMSSPGSPQHRTMGEGWVFVRAVRLMLETPIHVLLECLGTSPGSTSDSASCSCAPQEAAGDSAVLDSQHERLRFKFRFLSIWGAN